MSRYIDPTTDFGFKKLFGKEANKDIVMSFITDVLELQTPLADLRFLDKEQLPEIIEQRGGVYDLFCTDQQGKHYIVEMQKSPMEAVYCIAILSYAFDGSKTAINRNSLRNDMPPHELFYDKLRYITIELPLFDESKPEYSLDKHINKWLYFLNYLSDFDRMPEIFKGDAVFEKAFALAEIANLTPEDLREYRRSLKYLWDDYAKLTTAEQKGITKGKTEGKMEVAQALLKKGSDPAFVAEVTGLSMDQIQRIQNPSAPLRKLYPTIE